MSFLKKSALLVAIAMASITSEVKAQTWAWPDSTIRTLIRISMEPEGMFFWVSEPVPDVALPPNPNCAIRFIVERSHTDFEILASMIISAYHSGDAVRFTFDSADTTCNTPVNVFRIEK